MLVISNRPRASRSSDFEVTRAITPGIVLHSVQLLLFIVQIMLFLCLEKPGEQLITDRTLIFLSSQTVTAAALES